MLKLVVTNYLTRLVVASLLVALTACATKVAPIVVKDSAPDHKVDPDTILDAVPRPGPVTRAGNKNPYTVLGKTYHLLPTSGGYKERGVASWYGKKFQGHPTANGELYNLYAMTAAHRTLPLPAYVKITNLDNNRTAIVRVNDRGPFHSDRIIDLSYAAAVKLGYAERGTARVEVEVIDTRQASGANTATAPDRFFLQVGAFKSLDLANKLHAKLLLHTDQPVKISASEPAGYYRVQIGPLAELSVVQQISERLLLLNMGRPHLISE
jgi:rare lipoprotein A